MLLMQTVQDETMAVPGFEHHTFMCSNCHDIERRLTFAKPGDQAGPKAVPAEAVPAHVVPPQAASSNVVPLHAAPPILPTASAHAHAAAPGMFRRVLSKLRGG